MTPRFASRLPLLIALLGGASALWVMSLPGAPPDRDQAIPIWSDSDLFLTADRCLACHTGFTSATGEDISIGSDWRASMMANSARDPYWQAAVRREITDFPDARAVIEDECSKCHMPMARTVANADGRAGVIFDHLVPEPPNPEEAALALDGVSCSLCHQILPDNLGQRESFTGGYRVDLTTASDQREMFGPFDVDPGRTRIMHSATGFRPTAATHMQSSELCATCHTLETHALGAGAGSTLPEQVSYLEWSASAYAGVQSCQSCHMPEVPGAAPVTSVLGQPRDSVSRHVFVGGNFFMLRMLNRYRDELDVQAEPSELELAARRNIALLQSATARVDIESAQVSGGRLTFDVLVTNLAGHKFPVDYPSRRAWLHATVRDATGRVVFESGAFSPTGAVIGNANDEDPRAFEPHYQVIEREDQVQVYESIMAGPDSLPTTGLLTAVRYLKDNRLLPKGFDRASAPPEVAVRGNAGEDPDFQAGSDRIRYAVDLGTAPAPGPYSVEVLLWYQPIGYRWARNLADYDTPETNRFVTWFEEMAAGSAVVVAGDSVTVQP